MWAQDDSLSQRFHLPSAGISDRPPILALLPRPTSVALHGRKEQITRPVEIHLPLVRRQYLLPVLGSDPESREGLALDIPGVKLWPEKPVGTRRLSLGLIH